MPGEGVGRQAGPLSLITVVRAHCCGQRIITNACPYINFNTDNLVNLIAKAPLPTDSWASSV